MGGDANSDDVGERNICEHCVTEDYLKTTIQRDGADNECFYCGGHAKTITIEELAGQIATALDRHYYRTSDEPEGLDYLLAKEGQWERAGEPIAYVISEMAGIDEQPANDVREVLAESDDYDVDEAAAGIEGRYDEEAQYEEGAVRDHELQAQWSYFQRSLQTESRLFNRAAYATLETIFDGLTDHQSSDGRPILVEAGPDKGLSVLYRGRVFQSDTPLEAAMGRPDRELGPPPPGAATAGRMNAQGIAVFYGATDPAVALAETRPPVGGRVLVGAFRIIRPMILLDIEALSCVRVAGSVFDPTFLPALEKAQFLKSLSARISRPVMPDDAPFDYLVTQAIAEYLAGRAEPNIDGIIYSSVQSRTQRNVVLFHKSSRVAELDIPAGTAISAGTYHSTEDGPEPDYMVWEEVPSVKKEKKQRHAGFNVEEFLGMGIPRDPDTRDTSLRVEVESLRVHHIESVTYATTEFSVTRHRSEKRELPF